MITSIILLSLLRCVHYNVSHIMTASESLEIDVMQVRQYQNQQGISEAFWIEK